jgi:sporulation protein YlmC with PRC-barrel domain
MAHYGNLGSQRFGNRVDDIRGANIYGADDQKLGTLDDVILDHATMEIEYVVVDSVDPEVGKFLLPASEISADTKHPDHFSAEITKEESRSVPSYDEKTLKSESKWKKFLEGFKKWWEDSPVMHRKDRPDRIVTPPEEPADVQAGSTSGTPASSGRTGIPASQLFPERMTDKFSDTRPGAHKITLRPKPVARVEDAAQGAALLRPRWDTFEEFLSLNRAEILEQCQECGQESEGKRNIA